MGAHHLWWGIVVGHVHLPFVGGGSSHLWVLVIHLWRIVIVCTWGGSCCPWVLFVVVVVGAGCRSWVLCCCSWILGCGLWVVGLACGTCCSWLGG